MEMALEFTADNLNCVQYDKLCNTEICLWSAMLPVIFGMAEGTEVWSFLKVAIPIGLLYAAFY